MKTLLKKLLPEKLFLAYHFCWAILASLYYGFPSKKMVIIGVTGTKGKTSTANFIWSCLNAGGQKTGIITTANIKIGEKELLNKYHMTMPGRFILQKFLAQMVKEGCKYCVVETTSEGIKQSRHKGIDYNIAVFTNLSPEHLPSHGGSFEKYKETKGKMFAALTKHGIIIANNDSEHKDYFLSFQADKKITFGLKPGADYLASGIEKTDSGVKFQIDDAAFELSILGVFNVYNALPAIIIARLFGISDDLISKGLKKLTTIPGRMEIINEGQDFTVIVDYAHEKESMNAALDAVKDSGKIILLLGAEGGGRDKTKRPIMGEIAAKKADFVVVSNVDSYGDDPKEIVEDIAKAAEEFGKKRDEDLFVIEDRRAGIRKALSLAGAGDVVLITGKGAEQSIFVGVKSAWDDRMVVREELQA